MTCVRLVVSYLMLAFLFVGCAERTAPTSDTPSATPIPPLREHLIHLPGIAGEQHLDRNFVKGIREGGYSGEIEIFDWPGEDSGLRALITRQRNGKQADTLAARIQELL